MRIDRASDLDRPRGKPDPIIEEQTRRQEDLVARARERMTEEARRREGSLEHRRVSRERQRAQEAGPPGPNGPAQAPGRPNGTRLDVFA